MKICYIGGHWATNVGNAFYNLGATWLLSKATNGEVYFLPDPPQEYSQNVSGNYDLVSNVDADLFIITGPSWSKALISVYKNTFDQIAKAKKQIAFLSVGAGRYTNEEAAEVASFLSNYPVRFAFTRDRATYDLFVNRVNFPMIDGVCTSMFLDEALTIPKINDDYVVYNFRPFQEPNVSQEGSSIIIKPRTFFRKKDLNGTKIIRTATISFISNLPKLSSIALFDLQRYIYKLFDYHSDLPYGYLALYKSAKVVFSDRVHTCASALALGGKAMYLKTNSASKDGRSQLFARLKLDDIYNRPVSLNRVFVDEEKEKMLKNLVTHLS